MRMKSLLSAFLFLSCLTSNAQNDRIHGDFDGDGNIEYAYMTYPDVEEDFENIDFNDLVTVIHFSKESIPTIEIGCCVGGLLQNLGDLNNDGRDEIGLWRGWIASCWHEYQSWRFDGDNWTPLLEPFTIHCDLWDEYGADFKPIQRIDAQRVKVYYNEWDNDEIATKSKVLRLK